MELEIFFNLGAILFRVASTKRGIISDRAMSQWRRTFSLLSVHPSDRVAVNLLITAKITKIIPLAHWNEPRTALMLGFPPGAVPTPDPPGSWIHPLWAGPGRWAMARTSQERLSPDKNWKKFIHNSVVLWSWSQYRSRVGPDFLGGAGAEKIGRLRF